MLEYLQIYSKDKGWDRVLWGGGSGKGVNPCSNMGGIILG